MSEANVTQVPFWKRTLFSSILIEKSRAQKLAYAGVAAALCIVSNIFEFKFATVQFSFTVFTSILAGILIGPLLGFAAVFIGVYYYLSHLVIEEKDPLYDNEGRPRIMAVKYNSSSKLRS